MKKQSGFTLIELMVVMAIIAILATAGLSAYTGYIKKARDATRIADIAAINTIALGQVSVTGSSPTHAELESAISAANNGQMIKDPLGTGSCLAEGDASSGTAECDYIYQQCDSGTNFRILARFESASNGSLYNTVLASATATAYADATYYSVSQCSSGAAGSPNDASQVIE